MQITCEPNFYGTLETKFVLGSIESFFLDNTLEL